ncbi:hypothetical protein CEXT_758851 [Caerostris extrusa]|uniref:Uncharacterized protein n=1 Tax=Caerostris extrusa TaxID=172846 RepID=A0AAV4X281_CAEEX|nr:hypothetical protein CEXT_758851 [Caerostris extrusa]
MESQETRTQGVSGTNGMLHEAKVDRRVPKTVHLNKVTPCFRKIMKTGKDYIAEKIQDKSNCKDLFQFQLTPPGTETEKVRNSAPIFLVVALSHPPSSAPLSWKNAGSFIMPWNNSRQSWSFGRCRGDAGDPNSRREWNERNVA